MSGRRTSRAVEESEPLHLRDPDAARLVRVLVEHGGSPLTIEQLRSEGLHAPAQAIYELRLAGYEVERLAVRRERGLRSVGYRLRAAPDEEPLDPSSVRAGGGEGRSRHLHHRSNSAGRRRTSVEPRKRGTGSLPIPS